MKSHCNRRQFLGSAAAGMGLVLMAGGAGAVSPISRAFAMSHEAEGPLSLPPLPYAPDALEPHISARTFSFHYEKHHAGYVKKANAGMAKLGWNATSAAPLEDMIARARTENRLGLFNNLAQVWNHTFFWNSMAPTPTAPKGALLDAIKRDFGGMEACKKALHQAGSTRFASGWAWLVVNAAGRLEALNTMNADTPLSLGMTPLLTIDVWEHAYYLDYQNRRGDFLTVVIDKLLNWNFALENFQKA